MQKGILEQVESLENSLKLKIRELLHPGLEEANYNDLIKQTIHDLKESIVQVVKRFLGHVQSQLRLLVDPVIRYKEEIEEIELILKQMKRNWYRVISLGAKRTYQKQLELAKLATRIKAINPASFTSLDMGKIVKFKQLEFEKALSSAVKVKMVTKNSDDQRIILHKEGKYDLKTGKHMPLTYQQKFPFQYACFQLKSKLYVAGGEKEVNEGIHYLADLFAADEKGKCQNLSPMEKSRSALSLSGYGTLLIALGGSNGKNLRTCEEYQIQLNKWRRMHPLRLARLWAGSCVLKSQRAFCFCGGIAKGEHNSIETIQLDKGKEWELLTIDQEIAKTYHLAAVPLLGQIILFGGGYDSSSCLYVMTENGDILKDLSSDPSIPGYMCSTPAVCYNGKVYTIGQRQIEGKWERRAQVFEGLRWSFL